MLNRYKKAAIVIALTGTTALTGLAFAQASAPASGTGTPAVTESSATTGTRTQDSWLNLGQIYDKLTAAGYTDVREIERESDGYEAKARNADGRSVKLYVEPLEGRIVNEKARDRDGDRDRDDRRDRRHDRG